MGVTMTETGNESITVSYTITRADQQLVEAVALELGQARGRVSSRSAALRHILATYRRLDAKMRSVAIIADDVS